MVIEKILGVLSILGGIFFLFFFPDWKQFQPDFFTKTGILIGILLLLLGIYLMMM